MTRALVSAALVTVIATLYLESSVNAQSSSDAVAAFAENLPRNQWGEPMYWLEMHSLVGWERMMLVVGYAANGPVCDRLAAVARADAPNREFRCVVAN